ncbi:hypothetical protein D3C84_1045390 [compost metagenome]
MVSAKLRSMPASISTPYWLMKYATLALAMNININRGLNTGRKASRVRAMLNPQRIITPNATRMPMP